MCTIIALHKVHPDYPLIIAANRDEYYARPTREPQVLAAGPPVVVGGWDERGGGTWMGVTAAGFFAGLTNQRASGVPAGATAAPRSRGEVVMAVLRLGSVAAADDYLRTLDPGDYNSFNLLYGDARELRVAYGRRAATAVEVADLSLTPGVLVLANDRLGSAQFPKAARAQARAAALLTAEPPTFPRLAEKLRRILASHRLPPRAPRGPDASALPEPVQRQLQALCVHLPLYGTRSASVLALQPGRLAHYLHSAGPPCRARLVPQTALFAY